MITIEVDDRAVRDVARAFGELEQDVFERMVGETQSILDAGSAAWPVLTGESRRGLYQSADRTSVGLGNRAPSARYVPLSPGVNAWDVLIAQPMAALGETLPADIADAFIAKIRE